MRLTTDLVVLAVGYTIGTIQGVVVATTAVAAGVVVEAIYAGGQSVLCCGISCRSHRPSSQC